MSNNELKTPAKRPELITKEVVIQENNFSVYTLHYRQCRVSIELVHTLDRSGWFWRLSFWFFLL